MVPTLLSFSSSLSFVRDEHRTRIKKINDYILIDKVLEIYLLPEPSRREVLQT